MKAIVISVVADDCVIMKSNGEFSHVKNKGYQVGDEIFCPSRFILSASLCSAAMLTVMLLSALILIITVNTAVGYVYVDINPSFRLDVNRFGSVIDIISLNDEAQAIAPEASLSSNDLSTCIEHIVYLCELHGYIGGGENDLEISISSESKKIENLVLSATESAENENIQVSVYSLSEENAINYDESPKRLRAIKEYTHYFGGTGEQNKEKLKDYSADEIFELIREYRRSTKGEDEKKENSDISDIKYVSKKRLEALRKYTAEFGGSIEENIVLLRGLSTKEIHAVIKEHKKAASE